MSVFELGKCSLHKNGVEFHQKENGGKSSNIIGNCAKYSCAGQACPPGRVKPMSLFFVVKLVNGVLPIFLGVICKSAWLIKCFFRFCFIGHDILPSHQISAIQSLLMTLHSI